MNKVIEKWEGIGIAFLMIFGALFHFFFEWTGKIFPLAWLWPINESLWEHLKLVFFPLILWLMIEYKSINVSGKNIFLAKALEFLVICGIILGTFFIYTKFSNDTILAIDISSFYIGIIFGQIISVKIIEKPKDNTIFNWIGFGMLLGLLILFIIFTYMPPHLILFLDRDAQKYGFL
jgi:hypothetical protein